MGNPMIGDGGSPGRRSSPTAAESGEPTPCAARPVFEVTGSPSLLVLSGELDIGSASLLAAVLDPLTSPGGVIKVDLARLTFIDSCGVRVLCTAAQGLGPQGHLVVAVGTSSDDTYGFTTALLPIALGPPSRVVDGENLLVSWLVTSVTRALLVFIIMSE